MIRGFHTQRIISLWSHVCHRQWEKLSMQAVCNWIKREATWREGTRPICLLQRSLPSDRAGTPCRAEQLQCPPHTGSAQPSQLATTPFPTSCRKGRHYIHPFQCQLSRWGRVDIKSALILNGWGRPLWDSALFRISLPQQKRPSSHKIVQGAERVK